MPLWLFRHAEWCDHLVTSAASASVQATRPGLYSALHCDATHAQLHAAELCAALIDAMPEHSTLQL